ncbi:MAG: UDP-N-acetylglucosamine 4,6-dehydratase (inverting) [Pseudomonadota bacterium]
MDGLKLMVTGGTGSFGNAFCRHVLDTYSPERLIVYSRDEFKQYQMAERFAHDPRLRFFIGDVRDRDRLARAMKDVDIVFHAAAMKQVVASEYNPNECLHTNIHGAQNIIDAAIDLGVSKVVALSTDKAVKPVNLYGSSKACAEKLFTAANHLAGADGPRFCSVRYGNVIGSRGSVIPLFREQAKTGKVTITHKDMTRYWLRIEDGVEFVANCASFMHGGEVFVLKVPSMRVVDLAEVLAPDCTHTYIGIRPGEKLHEAMVSHEEAANTLEYEDFYVITPMIQMWGAPSYGSYLGQAGKSVAEGFSYSSDNNSVWLDQDDLLKLVSQTDVVHG